MGENLLLRIKLLKRFLLLAQQLLGKIISQQAAPLFKKVSLEMGGKNASIIFDDCDYEKTVATVLRAAFLIKDKFVFAALVFLFMNHSMTDLKMTFLKKQNPKSWRPL